MYTTTFYSFKGGVGRTMALVNTAVDLANRGRRVVAVDFDLEAPGLDSFTLLRPSKPGPGLIDFVHQFRETGQSPDVADFVYRASKIGKDGGELWVMPAGTGRDDYGVRFRDLDWAELYDRYDGYLLFEDLKAQWEKSLKADWVFVDSRTGHTDTGGICTRQLPDAVVIVFFPNEQNLRGLTGVVRDIRAEAETGRKKRIELHFVMSNVPDLDDEDQILQEQIESFRKELNMERPPVIVHRYDSLALLNQSVFIQDRPRSRLTREYKEIVRKVTSGNLDDRDGALMYLRESGRRPRQAHRARLESFLERERKLDRIKAKHAGDEEVLFELGQVYESLGEEEEAARFYEQAIQAGSTEPEALLFRSRMRAKSGDTDGATEDAMRVLARDDLGPRSLVEAIRIARGSMDSLTDSRAVKSLGANDRTWIGTLLVSQGSYEPGAAILESLEASNLRGDARRSLGIAYMALGRCEDAAEVFIGGDAEPSIQDMFNHAMARWGAALEPERDRFRRVLEMAHDSDWEGPNFSQCLAVAHWACGNFDVASEHLEDALQGLEGIQRPLLFSYWRYRKVRRNEFQEDLQELHALIEGEPSVRPHFIRSPDS